MDEHLDAIDEFIALSVADQRKVRAALSEPERKQLHETLAVRRRAQRSRTARSETFIDLSTYSPWLAKRLFPLLHATNGASGITDRAREALQQRVRRTPAAEGVR